MSLLRNIGVGKTKLIEEWLEEHVNILNGTYKINDDFTIDSDGGIYLNMSTPNMPEYIKFNKVEGEFDCSFCNKLTSLRGCPKECEDFICCECKNLTSLKGAPEIVHDVFNCDKCSKLKTLEGCPQKVHNFYAAMCGGQFTEEYVRSLCDVELRIEL